MKNPGYMFEFPGQLKWGISYHKEQKPEFGSRLLIKLVDHDGQPVISETTGKQVTVFKNPKELKFIGFID